MPRYLIASFLLVFGVNVFAQEPDWLKISEQPDALVRVHKFTVQDFELDNGFFFRTDNNEDPKTYNSIYWTGGIFNDNSWYKSGVYGVTFTRFFIDGANLKWLKDKNKAPDVTTNTQSSWMEDPKNVIRNLIVKAGPGVGTDEEKAARVEEERNSVYSIRDTEITRNGVIVNSDSQKFAAINGVTLKNESGIAELTYYGGTYEGSGSIGKLTAANGTASVFGFDGRGQIEELAFIQDSGLLTITGTAGDDGKIDYAGFGWKNVSAVNLTGVALAIDLSDAVGAIDAGGLNLNFNELFGAARVVEDSWTHLVSIEVIWGGGIDADLYDGSAVEWTGGAPILALTAPILPPSAAVPEPATMALFAFGIAGLAAARQLRRK